MTTGSHRSLRRGPSGRTVVVDELVWWQAGDSYSCVLLTVDAFPAATMTDMYEMINPNEESSFWLSPWSSWMAILDGHSSCGL